MDDAASDLKAKDQPMTTACDTMTSMTDTVRLLGDRTGIIYAGREISGFPYIPEMSAKAQHRVARWGRQLAPEALTSEQRQLLEGEPPFAVAKARRDASNQDVFLGSPLVRDLWDNALDPHERDLVLNPDTALQKRYPLSTGDLAKLVGASKRQIQYWSTRNLLPHWTADDGETRFFEAAAVIVAFALHKRKQNERQFYADFGTEDQPLRKTPEVVSLLGLRMLTVANGAEDEALNRTEVMLRTVADSLAQVRHQRHPRSV